jgi:hypothetical protein
MSGESLPPAVSDFLVRHIRSVEALEVLLLVHSDSERWWKPTEVYDAVRSSRASVGQRLEEFTAAGFLTKSGDDPPTFRYTPGDKLGRAVDETAAAYRTWRVRVIQTIFAAEVDPLKSFADAFKFRKE